MQQLFQQAVCDLLNIVRQELKKSHNALGMINQFTRALLRVELAAVKGDLPSQNMFTPSPIESLNILYLAYYHNISKKM